MNEMDFRILRLALKLVETVIEELEDDLYGKEYKNSVYHLRYRLSLALGTSYEDLE